MMVGGCLCQDFLALWNWRCVGRRGFFASFLLHRFHDRAAVSATSPCRRQAMETAASIHLVLDYPAGQCFKIGKILRPPACTPRIRYRARIDSHDRQPFGQASPKVGQAPDHQKGTWYIALVWKDDIASYK